MELADSVRSRASFATGFSLSELMLLGRDFRFSWYETVAGGGGVLNDECLAFLMFPLCLSIAVTAELCRDRRDAAVGASGKLARDPGPC